MPVTKTAKRALRVSAKKTIENQKTKRNLEIAIKKAKKNPSDKAISLVFSLADRAAKKFVIHKNKAARIKSSLQKAK